MEPTTPRSELRKTIQAVLLTDSDFDAFCGDYFPAVASRFTNGMDRQAKLNLLLDLGEGSAIRSALRVYDPERLEQTERLRHSDAPQSDSPYRGLSVFETHDAHLFFGREGFTEKLWQRYQALYEAEGAVRLLGLLGPSGTGKSSLARAGLMAMLTVRPGRAGSIRRVVLKPGAHPLRALALSLLSAQNGTATSPDVGARQKLIEDLGRPNSQGELDGLALFAASSSDKETAPLLLLVDQFEELYALCATRAERDTFVGLLLYAAGDRARQVSVVLTLRSDFLGETQRQHPDLNRLLGEQSLIVTAMNQGELRRAIAEPACRAGRPIDEATIARLLTEVQSSEGALPLLEFALTRIWAGMQHGTAPSATLHAIGGVGGALAFKAREIYGKLTEHQQATARRALSRLVQLGEGTRDTRRRVSLRDLCGRNETEAEVLAVLRPFSASDARLITLRGEGQEAEAEVTHEALLEHFSELREWIDESRADRRFHDRLAAAARLWDEAGRPNGRLWRRPDLDLLRQYARRKPEELSPLQAEFLHAAKRQRIRERITAWGAGTVILAAIALAVGIYILKEKQRTQEAAEAGEEFRQQLLSTYVEQGRRLLLEQHNPSEALLWLQRAQDGVKLRNLNGWILVELLRNADLERARSAPVPLVLIGHWDNVLAAKFSLYGRRILTAGTDQTARIWDAETGEELAQLKGHRKQIWTAMYNPDGRRVVTTAADQTVRIWDAESGKQLGALLGPTINVVSARYSPDGRRIVTASFDFTARVWDAETGKSLATLTGHRNSVRDAVFSPDSRRIATVSNDQTSRVWDAETGKLLAVLSGHDGMVYASSFSPDGRHILTVSEDKTARIWDTESGKQLAILRGHENRVSSGMYSPDGRHIVTSSEDHTARIWEAETGKQQIMLTGHNAYVIHARYSPDGRRIVTSSQDNTARVWDAESGKQLALHDGHWSFVSSAMFSPDGRRVVTASYDRTARVWDAETGKILYRPQKPQPRNQQSSQP